MTFYAPMIHVLVFCIETEIVKLQINGNKNILQWQQNNAMVLDICNRTK